MSTGHSTVDERIVEMRIDNEKFEAGAKKTIGILESLDRSLKGLGQDNADGFNNIEKSLDKVTDRFSAMGIVGDQIMRNLTNRAMEMIGQFKNMATMLTTQQIDAGWNKYADKTQAIQTIMAATNKTIEEGRFADQAEQLEWVNKQIQKLNKFTDETSYNFLDMVGNIGKFTAAGRELEESVTAMEGIANWAAISGGRPAEASRAMYNLSQALGMGKVTQLDWKSIENANMATYEFKQQVIDVAEELGTITKIADGIWADMEGHEVTVESFRENLKDGWFDSDVLLKVLNRYGEFSDVLLDVSDKTGKTATEILSQIKAYKENGRVVNWLSPYIKDLTKDEYELGLRAFQAAQEAKTFTEAIEATKDAVSTKWMDVFELLFGNYLQAKELWTQMSEVFWNIFAQPVDHLIEIIEGSQGFLSKKGWVASFSNGMEQAAGGTAVLEDRLTAVGKTMKDFEKAIEKLIGPKETVKLLNKYKSIEDALLNGAISAETFKKALGVLDDNFDVKKPVTLNRALNKAGKTMEDFEKALKEAMDPKDVVKALGSYESIEAAFRSGAISVDDFKEALVSLGIDSENVTEEIDSNVQASIGSLEELRKFALEVLSGEHGNGDERLAWYASMGLDPELMQAMAGDLKNMGYYVSDEMLLAAMESYYQYNNLAARLGYETFSEYLASISSSTSETIYDMNQMANEADAIYASIFGQGVLDEAGELVSAGELFRKSLSNLLEALDKFGEAFDKAFLKVFGGSEDYDESILNMSDGFFTLTAAFYSFSDAVLRFSQSDAFLNFATSIFSILRLIGKTIGFVFKIGKTALSVILKLLSPILKLVSTIFNAIATGIDSMSRAFESSGILEFIDNISDNLLKKISEPIEKINDVIDKLVKAFRDGFNNGGGIVGGLRNMSKAMDQLFQNHPVFLTVIHAIGKALVFLKDVAEGVALVLGSVFGGAIIFVISVFQKLGEWFGQLVTWVQSSELLSGIWSTIVEIFQKFGRVVKRVFGYAEQGFQENGFMGAITAVADSFERGITRLIPGGKKLVEIIRSVKGAFSGLFKKKVVDENGMVQIVDETENAFFRLGEVVDTVNTVTREGLGNEEQQATFRERVRQFVSNAWKGFLEGLRDIRISDVISALRLGVISNILLKVGHSLNIFNQIGENIKDIPETFSDMFEDLGRTFRSLSFDLKANAVLKFAASATMIAGAIWILSKIPDKDLEKASSVVIAILTVLGIFSTTLGNTSSSIFKTIQYLPTFGTALIGLAMIVSSIGTTALILALTAKFVGVGPLKDAAKVVLTFVIVIAALLAALIVVVKKNKFNEWQIKSLGLMLKNIGVGLIAVALAVQMLMIPVLAFSLVLKLARGDAGLKKFGLAVGAVVAILLTIGVMVWLITSAVNGFTAEQIGQIGTFMIKLAASLMIVALALNMLTTPILILAAAQKVLKLNVNGIVGAISVFMILGGLLALLLTVFAGVMSNKDAAQIKAVGNLLLKFAASMLAISLAIDLMAVPIIAIAKLSEKMQSRHIVAALMVLLGMIGVLSLLLTVLGKVILKNNGSENATRLGEGLLKISKAILLLAAAGLVMTPAIILMTAAIAGFVYVLGRMDDKRWAVFENGLTRLRKFIGPLVKFGAALLVIGMAATLTGTGIVAMSLGILVFAGAIAIVMMAIPKLVETISKLKEMEWNDILKQLKKIASILGVLSLLILGTVIALRPLLKLLGGGGGFKTFGTAIIKTFKDIATGMRTGLSDGFTKAIEFLKDEKNKETILAILESLVLVGAAYVAGILPTVAHVIVGGIVGLLNAVASEISAQAPDIVDAVNNIVSALVKVAAGLLDSVFGTEFLTRLTESEEALNRVTGAVEAIGVAYAGLKIVGKFKQLKGVISGTGGVVGAVTELSTVTSQVDEAMIALSGSSEGYFSVITSSLFTIFAVVGLTALAVGSLAVAFRDLAEQAKNESDAMNEALYGDKDASIEKRADNLEEITDKYDDVIAKEEELKAKMREAEKSGVSGAYEAAVDEYLDGAEERIKYINDVESSYEQLAHDMANVLLPDAGIFKRTELARDILFKMKEADGDLSKVAEYQQYLELTAQTEEELTEATSEATAVAKQLSDAESWRQEQLERRKLKTQEATTATQEETAALQAETEVVKEETTAVNGFFDTLKNSFGSGEGDLLSMFGLDDASILDDTTSLREKLKLMLSPLGDTKWIDQLSDTDLKSVGSNIIAGLTAGVDSPEAQAELIAALQQCGDIIPESLKERLKIASPSAVMADEVGKWIPAGVGRGIDQNWYMAVNPLYTLMDEMTSTFTNIRDRFVSSGAEVVSGLAQGIADNMQYAYDIGQNLAISLENGFRNQLAIRSPSRVFAELARYIPLGISEGVNSESTSAITSVTVLGDALINAIMQSMAMVSTIADEDFELMPRITPVVDMSNVNSAAGSMNGMFGGGYAMSAQMTDAISRRMADVERVASNIGNSQTINNGDNITFNIYGAEGQDPNEIADAVMLRMQNRAVRRGAAFG